MRAGNVPRIDARYWLALLAASLFGTASGDFCADVLDFGFLGGLLPFALLLAGVFVAERRVPAAMLGCYWAAIVITRTAATNVADYLTHDLALGYAATDAALLLLLAALLLGQGRGEADAEGRLRLSADARYWVAVMLAGILGTAAGDTLSEHLGLGHALAAACVLTALALAWQIALHPPRKLDYWVALLAVRVSGTVGADSIASEHGLGLGLRWSLPLTGALLLATLALPRRAAAATAEAA